MKTIILILLFGFTSTSLLAQESNYFKRNEKNNLFSKYSKYVEMQDKKFDLPVLTYNSRKDLNAIRLKSDITVFKPKGNYPFIIYPFDPKMQGYLKVIYPRQ